jgi:hypothetical protein
MLAFFVEESDQGSDAFFTLDPGGKIFDPVSRINIPDPQQYNALRNRILLLSSEANNQVYFSCIMKSSGTCSTLGAYQ